MFNIGDYVVYGTGGVCVVKEITTSPFGGGDLRVYYALNPVDDSTAVIYTPSEGGRVKLRAVMTADEARSVLEAAENIEPLTVLHEKQRKDIYKAAMAESSPEQHLRVIKSVCVRRSDAAVGHRQLAVTDSESERVAKYCLYNEIAMVLGMTFAEVDGIIRKKME